MTKSPTKKPTLSLVAQAVGVGALLHLGTWFLAKPTDCYPVGIGGLDCPGFGLGGVAVIMSIGFIGAPTAVMFMLRRIHQPGAAVVAWGSQFAALLIATILFRPLFRADVHIAPLLWELTAQLGLVPIASLILAWHLQRRPLKG